MGVDNVFDNVTAAAAFASTYGPLGALFNAGSGYLLEGSKGACAGLVYSLSFNIIALMPPLGLSCYEETKKKNWKPIIIYSLVNVPLSIYLIHKLVTQGLLFSDLKQFKKIVFISAATSVPALLAIDSIWHRLKIWYQK